MKPTVKFILFLAFTIAILLQNQVSAQSIENFDVSIQLSGMNSLVSYAVETDLPEIAINPPLDAKIISCSENYTRENNQIKVALTGKKLLLDYSTESFIEKAGKSYFTADLSLPAETKNLTVRLILPESSTLEKAFPEPILTSDGRHIILSWNIKNAEASLPIFVVYNEQGGIFGSIEIISGLFGIAFIIAIILFLLSLKKSGKIKDILKTKKKAKLKGRKELHLLESEASIVNFLKQSRGSAWQKQIQLKTGFSKAKLSRVIRDLEARKLVKKIPLGNTNKIRLLNR